MIKCTFLFILKYRGGCPPGFWPGRSTNAVFAIFIEKASGFGVDFKRGWELFSESSGRGLGGFGEGFDRILGDSELF